MGPRICLAIDNCFASKRWSEPADWMRVVRDLGITCVEASADNEIDPLYSCHEYLDGWVAEVERLSAETGVRVVNCYSGHGTYSTLGLGHPDRRVRQHLKDRWMRPMIATAGRLGAGLGFFAHAFPEKVLCDSDAYHRASAALIADLQELSQDALDAGVTTFGVEQMYTPHQIPWTIRGTCEFLRRANDKTAGSPIYITLDTGHQCGQRRFLPPDGEAIDAFVRAVKDGEQSPIYLGPKECYQTFTSAVRSGIDAAALRDAIERHVRDNAHLFAAWEDGDTCRWIREFACYSPILHLQQTDGTVSAHKCFTSELNAWGNVRAEDVLCAIRDNAEQEPPPGFPPRAEVLYLTLEPFLPTASHPRLMLEQIAESVEYWRRYVPKDGLAIETLCETLQ